MPILNWISFRDEKAQTDEELKIMAKETMDKIGKLELFINNRPLDVDLFAHRDTPYAFYVTLPVDNILGATPGPTRLVTDGYWIFLKPLKNEFKMTSSGSCSSGITEIGVNYSIKIS